MERITVEVTHVNGARTCRVRAVQTEPGYPTVTTDAVSVPVAESLPRRWSECELYELRQAIEQEIRGWAAKLPLGYD